MSDPFAEMFDPDKAGPPAPTADAAAFDVSAFDVDTSVSAPDPVEGKDVFRQGGVVDTGDYVDEHNAVDVDVDEDVDAEPDEPVYSKHEKEQIKHARKAAKRAEKREKAQRREQEREEKRAARAEIRGERKTQAPRYKLRGVQGNITRTHDQLMLWFVEPPGAWSMRSLQKQDQAIEDHALVFARLAEEGIPFVKKRTIREPWPVTEWAQSHDSWAEPLPDVEDALSWADYLEGHQRGLQRTNTTLKRQFWGIPLTKRGMLADTLERVASALPERDGQLPVVSTVVGKTRAFTGTVADREIDNLSQEISQITRIMGDAALGAKPATPKQMNQLLYRSVTLGLPIPTDNPIHIDGVDTWDEDDLDSLLSVARPEVVPGDGYTKVSGYVEGQFYERYVAVLTIGRMGRMPIPEGMLPWLVLADKEALPLEVSEHINLQSSEETRKALKGQIDKVNAQYKHYTVEHNEIPPEALERQRARAMGIQSEIDHDQSMRSSRTNGWYRLAVTGTSPSDVMDKVERVRKAFKPNVQIEHENGQYALLREFVPGEPLANTAHKRQMSVVAAASAMPHVSDRIGDRTGILIGETASISSRPVAWDTHAGPEKFDKSGLTPIVGGLGSGKTFFAGMCTYQMVRAGVHGVILDPSGPLQNLGYLPELKPYSRIYNLTRHSNPGVLNPYRVIMDPNPKDELYSGPGGEDQLAADRKSVQSERSEFVSSVLRMMLPAAVANHPETDTALGRASMEVGGSFDHEPSEVIAALRELASDDKELSATYRSVADNLDRVKNLNEARIIFPKEGSFGGWDDLGEEMLTIMTMPGLQLPPEGESPANWTPQQRLSVPIMHLAAWQANRLIYERPRWMRKLLFLDENKYLDSTGAGKTLNLRVARDSRKYDVRAFKCSQLPKDFLGLEAGGDEAAALNNEVFIGSLGSVPEAIKGAVKLLSLPENQGYEELVARLGRSTEQTYDKDVLDARGHRSDEPREFIARMADDLEIIRADWRGYPHLAHVMEALNSRPGATKGKAA